MPHNVRTKHKVTPTPLKGRGSLYVQSFVQVCAHFVQSFVQRVKTTETAERSAFPRLPFAKKNALLISPFLMPGFDGAVLALVLVASQAAFGCDAQLSPTCSVDRSADGDRNKALRRASASALAEGMSAAPICINLHAARFP